MERWQQGPIWPRHQENWVPPESREARPEPRIPTLTVRALQQLSGEQRRAYYETLDYRRHDHRGEAIFEAAELRVVRHR